METASCYRMAGDRRDLSHSDTTNTVSLRRCTCWVSGRQRMRFRPTLGMPGKELQTPLRLTTTLGIHCCGRINILSHGSTSAGGAKVAGPKSTGSTTVKPQLERIASGAIKISRKNFPAIPDHLGDYKLV